MDTDPTKLLKSHKKLNHSELKKIVSHSQREKGDWFINSIMVEGCDVPFKYKRKTKYQQLRKGQRVNLTYYPLTEKVAGLEFETMKVVRIKLS
ncbi:MAG: hypothetical protein KUG78_03225 [Kangiellaceae bacterium]|nr:hypothetical protein [Kangiellaceae bacterium]